MLYGMGNFGIREGLVCFFSKVYIITILRYWQLGCPRTCSIKYLKTILTEMLRAYAFYLYVFLCTKKNDEYNRIAVLTCVKTSMQGTMGKFGQSKFQQSSDAYWTAEVVFLHALLIIIVVEVVSL